MPDLPVLELVARGAVVYAALLLMLRLSGKRTVGQFTPFDLLLILLISEAASNALTGGDETVAGGLIVCATLISLNAVVGVLTARYRGFERLVEGEAVLLGRNGRLFRQALQRHRISEADMKKALREADCRLQDLRCAFLEANGSISILRRERTADSSDTPQGDAT